METEQQRFPCNRLQGILQQNIVLLDGGSATEMVNIGYKSIDSDPLWSARLLKSNPEAVKQVHKNFLRAGSEILDTASYQATVDGFVRYMDVREDEALRLIGRSVELAREACIEEGKDAVVAGCVGPYGAALHDGSEYNGTYVENMTIQELCDWHRPRVRALLDAGADMLAVDTIPSLKEAEAILELLKEFPNARTWISFSCKDSTKLCHGENFADAIRTVSQSDQVLVVGLNCTSPEYVAGLLHTIRHISFHQRLMVKPNIGEVWRSGIGWIPNSSSNNLAAWVKQWVASGASWVGGCCQVFSEDIASIKVVLDAIGTERTE